MKIVHTFGRNAGLVQTLDKPTIRFGRMPDNDVAFDPEYDRDASGHHAEIRAEGGGLLLVDLASKNGTFVRGERVQKRLLEPGDEVTFGSKGPRVRVDFAKGAAQPAVMSPPPVPGAGTVPAAPIAPRAAMPSAGRIDPRPQAFAAALGPPPAPPPPGAPPPAARQGSAPMFAGGAAAAPAPPQAAPAGAPPAGKRVGQKTIAYMISSAVSAARGRGGGTRELSAYVDREVGAATAAQKRTTTFLAVLLLVAIAALGGLVVWSSRSSDEIDRLRTDLAKLPPDDPRRKDIEGRLGTLHPSNASFGRNLYDRSKKGIFMLAAGGQGFCTAFAVRPNTLATNAHCVAAARRRGGSIVALENEGRGAVSFPVTDMRPHPGYRDNDATSITPDVGIMTISGKAAIVLDIASSQELAAMGVGDDVYIIGFPGRLMDTSNPAATFLAAHVGRITNASGRPASFGDQWLVQHDAPTTHGTSGSPVFNGKGKVVAINAGGYLEGDDETIAGRKTEVVKASPYKFGMRIDLLNALLR